MLDPRTLEITIEAVKGVEIVGHCGEVIVYHA